MESHFLASKVLKLLLFRFHSFADGELSSQYLFLVCWRVQSRSNIVQLKYWSLSILLFGSLVKSCGSGKYRLDLLQRLLKNISLLLLVESFETCGGSFRLLALQNTSLWFVIHILKLLNRYLRLPLLQILSLMVENIIDDRMSDWLLSLLSTWFEL